MLCDICGSEAELYRARVEGTEINVCLKCSKFGELLGPVKKILPGHKKESKQVILPTEPQFIEIIVPDFAEKIRRKREQAGLDQEQFAKLINQKKSIVHKMENNEFTPDIELAKGLEKLLNLRLVEEYKEEPKIGSKSGSEEVTIGDFIKIKQRKRQ